MIVNDIIAQGEGGAGWPPLRPEGCLCVCVPKILSCSEVRVCVYDGIQMV